VIRESLAVNFSFHHLLQSTTTYFFVYAKCFFSDLMKGYKAAEKLDSEEPPKSERSLWAHCQAIADMKFTYVVSCQQYGIDKRSGDPRAKDILKLMTEYVSHIKLLSSCCFSKQLSIIFLIFVVSGTRLFG
jgi:hypothetical protein